MSPKHSKMENDNGNANPQNGEAGNSNPPNGEGQQDLSQLEAPALRDLLTKTRESLAEVDAKNRQLFERAKRAEGFEKQTDGSWVKIVEKSKPGRPPKDTAADEGSTELDYSQKAFLLAKGIEEFDLVMEEAKKFGGDLKNIKLEDLIDNPYFKQRLQEVRTTKANQLAADGGSGKTSGSPLGKNSADYWLAKLGPNDVIPSDLSRDLREKIVEARRAKGRVGAMFYNE